MSNGPLTGFTIGVTADRRADEQIELLTRRGATVLRAPVIRTHPLTLGPQLKAATEALVAEPPDVTMLSTGIGVRGWFDAAETYGLADDLTRALERSSILARGPKARGAALASGLRVDWQTPSGRAAEMVHRLRAEGAAGRRVAVQADGNASLPLARAVREAGATPVVVPVYEWTLPADTRPAERLVDAVVSGRVDGLTFTARPQVDNLLAIAASAGHLGALRDAWADLTVVCVGPVCAEAVVEAGLPSPVQPARFRLGSMVHVLEAAFVERSRPLRLGGHDLRIQGRSVVVDDAEPIALSDLERLVLAALAERPGAVRSKPDLLRTVWGEREGDPHVVEVTVGRLRNRLGPAGAGIETVIRRGYRLSAE